MKSKVFARVTAMHEVSPESINVRRESKSPVNTVAIRRVPVQESWYSLETKKNYDERLALIRELAERKDCEHAINHTNGQRSVITNDTAAPENQIQTINPMSSTYFLDRSQYCPSPNANHILANYLPPNNPFANQNQGASHYFPSQRSVAGNQYPCNVVNATHPFCPSFQNQFTNIQHPFFAYICHAPQLAGPGFPSWVVCPYYNNYYDPRAMAMMCCGNPWGQQNLVPHQYPCRHGLPCRRCGGTGIQINQAEIDEETVQDDQEEPEVEEEELVYEEGEYQEEPSVEDEDVYDDENQDDNYEEDPDEQEDEGDQHDEREEHDNKKRFPSSFLPKETEESYYDVEEDPYVDAEGPSEIVYDHYAYDVDHYDEEDYYEDAVGEGYSYYDFNPAVNAGEPSGFFGRMKAKFFNATGSVASKTREALREVIARLLRKKS